MKQLYEGKAKIIYELNDSEVIIHYKDDTTAGNGLKKESIAGKGVLNNKITTLLFEYLMENGIETHFIKVRNDRDQQCHKVTVIPLEVIVRNYAAGSIVKRLGFQKGVKFQTPTVEFSYKKDELGDPLLNDDHAIALGVATKEELEYLKQQALKINQILIPKFSNIGMTLVDFKLEFGKKLDGSICLVDELSPDNCRLWDEHMVSFDKDLFREDKGDLVSGYQKIYDLLRG